MNEASGAQRPLAEKTVSPFTRTAFVRISNEFALDGLVTLRAWGWKFGIGAFKIHPSWGRLWFSEYGEGKVGPKGRLP